MKNFIVFSILSLALSLPSQGSSFFNGDYRSIYGGGQFGMSQEFYCDGLQMPCDDQYGNLFRLTPGGAQLGIPGLFGINLRQATQYGANPWTPNMYGQRGNLNPAWSLTPWAEYYMPRMGYGRRDRVSATRSSSRSGATRTTSRDRDSDRKEKKKNRSKPVAQISERNTQGEGDVATDDNDGASGVEITTQTPEPETRDLTDVPVGPFPPRIFPVPLDPSLDGVCDEPLPMSSRIPTECSSMPFVTQTSERDTEDVKPAPLVRTTPKKSQCKPGFMTPSEMIANKDSAGEYCPECIQAVNEQFGSSSSMKDFTKKLTCMSKDSPGAYYAKLYEKVPEPCINQTSDAKLYACMSKSLEETASISKVIVPKNDGKSCTELASQGKMGSCGSVGVLNSTFNSFKLASKCLNIPKDLLFKVMHHESRFNLNAVLRFDGDPNYGEAGLGQSTPEAISDMAGKSKWSTDGSCSSLKFQLTGYVKGLRVSRGNQTSSQRTKNYQCSAISSVSKDKASVAGSPTLKQSLLTAAVLNYNLNHYQDAEYRRSARQSSCANTWKATFAGLSATEKKNFRQSVAMLGYNRGAATAVTEMCSYLKYLKMKNVKFDISLVQKIESQKIQSTNVPSFANYLKQSLDRPNNDSNWNPILSKRIRSQVRSAIEASGKSRAEIAALKKELRAVKSFEPNGLPRISSANAQYIKDLFETRLKSYAEGDKSYLHKIETDKNNLGAQCNI